MPALIRHLLYGAFIEKRWRIATVAVGECASPLDALEEAGRSRWDVFPLPDGVTFLADGFFAPDGAILCEAMDARSAKGRLFRFSDNQTQALTEAGHVWSYPFVLDDLVLPETATWRAPAAYRLSPDGAEKAFDLQFDRPERLIDPTFFAHDGRVFLFANRLEEGADCLRLWVAPSLDGRFEEHPASPIHRSKRGSRMAGRVMRWNEGLFRLGQDWREHYGDGLIAFRITELTLDRYAEEEVGDFHFDHVKGPHTLDLRDNRLLFDYYEHRFSWLAGWRRFKGRRT